MLEEHAPRQLPNIGLIEVSYEDHDKDNMQNHPFLLHCRHCRHLAMFFSTDAKTNNVDSRIFSSRSHQSGGFLGHERLTNPQGKTFDALETACFNDADVVVHTPTGNGKSLIGWLYGRSVQLKMQITSNVVSLVVFPFTSLPTDQHDK